jgi:Common central domain of tyrosinase/Polyphenol oxidase middle domain
MTHQLSGESHGGGRGRFRRRTFLISAAVATAETATAGRAVARGAPWSATAAQRLAGPYARRDVWSLGSPWNAYTEAYARAVLAMQARSPSDPTSWSYQAAVHGTFVQPSLTFWNKCQHQSWHFFPWHRMYLYYFERIVRQAALAAGGPADFALPYWNYDQVFPANTLPSAFREPTLPDGTSNPLYLPTRRNAAMMNGFQLTTRMTSAAEAMSLGVFAADPGRTSFGGGPRPAAQFGGSLGVLERQPHNVIHNQLGGPSGNNCNGVWMSVIKCAANDPVFFMHHANIDRLWDVWLAQGGGRANPNDGAWRNQSFTFHDETGAAVSLTTADVLDSVGQLGYGYL